MGAIAGLLVFDEGALNLETCGEMLRVMRARGPGCHTLWRTRQASLGFAALSSTTGSREDPATHLEETGGTVITADIRLDNREDLIGNLSLPAETPDSRIVLCAYLRWGTRCLSRLLGDFAFAIWDNRCQRLFCGAITLV